MKFTPTWPQVALLAVLLAAIIISHLVAPLAVSAITSIVSTIIGALFVNLRKSDSEDGAEAEPARVLRLVPGGSDDKKEGA